MARKDAIVQRSNTGVEGWLKSTENVTVYEGHGRFEGPHTICSALGTALAGVTDVPPG